MSDFKYSAEYAKSNRSSCKGCKCSIGKDSLRLAIMVQSPMFDAKIPNWYHQECFFKKVKVNNISDIGNLDALRWDDQEWIKKNSGSDTGTESSSNLDDFKVEYAKSGKSSCRSCESLIPKGEVRIGITEHEGEKAARFGPYKQWFHCDCFVKERDDLNFFESGDELPGFALLNDDDQLMVKKKLKAVKKRKAETKNQGKEKVQKVEAKVDVKEQKQMKAQSKLIYEHRDLLQELSKKEMISLLEYNKQHVPSGESALLDTLSDIMTFGALIPCCECENGQFMYSHGIYKCSGNMSEWTKCQVTSREPKRVALKAPSDLKEKFEFLAKYKYKKRTRILPKEQLTQSIDSSNEVQLTKIKEKESKPLHNMKLAIVGKLKKSKAELKKEIQELGGEVTTTIDKNILAVISTESELRKCSRKIQEAENHDVHVVSEEFLDHVKKGGAAIMVSQCSLSTWGSDPNERISFSFVQKKQMKEEDIYTKRAPSKMKMKIKGGACVEPDSGLEDEAHVYVNEGAIYSVVLGNVDVVKGTNSYYKLQLLEGDRRNSYWIYRAWGRLGTTIGGSKLESFFNKRESISAFCSLYEEKTGNAWSNRNNFQKVRGKSFPMEIDFGQEDESIQKLNIKESHSKLPKEIQDMICLIFDVDSMKRALVEYEIDLKKMPLGKISKRQIQSAYQVLTEVLEVIKDGSNANKLLDASNKFYTLIPHDFGMKKPPLLNSKDLIKKKIEMLDSLLEIEIACNLLKDAQDDKTKDPVDIHYEKLKTDISVLDHSCDEFKMIKKYVQNTHGSTHDSYNLTVLEAFKVNRHGEDKRFKPFKKLHNRKLLWHGSRKTNFGGILSQGLRIAPPEAPSTGYMFGKGIYFADIVSKSANYCWTSSSDPIGIMLLCDVALGNMYERDHSDYITKLPDGMHSTKGRGSNIPDPDHAIKVEDNIEVPLGKQVDADIAGGSLLYNEYIVYDTAQVKMKYLLKMGFKYQW